MPDFALEARYSGKIIAGVDEAGCGPWAGPVVAAAVILNPENFPEGLNDSKKLSAKKREALFQPIKEMAQVGVGIVDVHEIDEINILQAAKAAMQRAVADLPIAPEVALIDGNRPVKLPCETQLVVKGDSLSLSIAAASIIAKVTRDRMMQQLAAEFPHYGWEKNAGYGTAQHQAGLAIYGVTKHHRKSFAPIRKLLEVS